MVLVLTAGGRVPGSALSDVDTVVIPTFDALAVKESVTFNWLVESGVVLGDTTALPLFVALTVGGDLTVNCSAFLGTISDDNAAFPTIVTLAVLWDGTRD